MMDGRLLVLGVAAAFGAASALRAHGSAKKAAPFAEGASVRLQVAPGLRALYGVTLPKDGTVGRVASMAFGPQSASFVAGPRGGLVFVDFGGKHPVGVSPEDLTEQGSKGVVRGARPAPPIFKKSTSERFDVFLNRKNIDSVSYSGLRGTVAEKNEEVRRSLIGHDGYDPNIVIRRRPVKKGSRGVVRAGKRVDEGISHYSAPKDWPQQGHSVRIFAGAAHFLEREEFTLPEITGRVEFLEDGFLQLLADDVTKVPDETRKWNLGEQNAEGLVEIHEPFNWLPTTPKQGSSGVLRKGRPAPLPDAYEPVQIPGGSWGSDWWVLYNPARNDVASYYVDGGYPEAYKMATWTSEQVARKAMSNLWSSGHRQIEERAGILHYASYRERDDLRRAIERVYLERRGSRGVIRKGRPAPPVKPILETVIVEGESWKLTWSPSQHRIVQVESGTFSDQAVRYSDGRLAWDFPERIPPAVKQAAKKIYKEADRRL